MSYQPTLADTPSSGYVPKLSDTPEKSAVENLLSQLPDRSEKKSQLQQLDEFLVRPEDRPSVRRAAGYGIMMGGPELKILSKIPYASSLLPAKGAGKILTDYLSNIGKVGTSAALGSKVMGLDNTQSAMSGLSGAGISAITTLLSMATSSLNPLVRLVAGTGLGSLAGYGIGQITGGSPYTTAGGGIAGGLLGLRGGGAAELAARNAAESLTPEQVSTAIKRENAGAQIGIPLTLAEKTGSPVIGAMQQEAAMSGPGSKILYPFGLRRQGQEEKAYQDLLDKISPKNAKATIEDKAYQAARNSNAIVNVNPVIKHIDQELPKYEEGSKIAKALKLAKDRLSLTPETSKKFQQQLEPFNNLEQGLQQNALGLQNKLEELNANPPNSYLGGMSNHQQQVDQLQQNLAKHQQVLSDLQLMKHDFMQKSGISPYENTVEGLHNAKLGIQGLIEGQGENAIGNTAAGKLKQVNKILTKQIKQASPEYAAASHISNLRQTRETIEDAMASSSLSGSNFYDKILTNRNNYNDFYRRLGDPSNPKKVTAAQSNLAAMKEAFPDLIDNLTAKSGKALAEKAGEIHVSLGGLAKSFLNKIYMDRYNKAVAELMINPKWADELHAIAKMKSGEDRGIRLGRLISKAAITGGVGAYNDYQQGSSNNGTQL
jgi:hypothetical protein